MNPISRLAELDILRRQVTDLAHELTEREQAYREQHQQLDDELVDLREQSEMLRAIVTGTAAETGDDFFPTLVSHLSSVLGVQYAVVGEIQQGPIKTIRTIAVSAGGVSVDNFEYPLPDTPCETTLGQSFACFEQDIRTIFPACERLAQLNVEGYCGVSLRAKGGAVLGLLVVMDTKPLHNTERLKSLMTVFASRAGAELQRRQAERKLHQQQRHLIEAQALAHLGSWDWDINSGHVQWSAELFRIFGYKPGAIAVTYDAFLTSLHTDDHDRVRQAINDALTGQTVYDVECRIVRPGGEIRAIHCLGEVVLDDEGHPVSLSSSVLDITDRKRVEEALQTSQEQLQQALQASGTGLWEWNTETNTVGFSEEWKRQLGYEPAEISDLFETWTTLLHPEDRERAIARVHEYVLSREGDYRQEFRLRHKDGTYRWIESRASFVTEGDGRQIRLLGSHTDITERKQMEEAIRESKERYRTLVELSPSGVFVFCEGRTVYVNQTGTLLMGARDPQEILDRSTFEFIHPDYHRDVRENVARLLGGGVSIHSAERVYVRMDGTTIPVQVEAGRITWNGKPAILGLFSDITERKGAEEALANLNVTLERQVGERTDALRRSEERFRQFFDYAPNATCLKDCSGRYLYTNRRFDEVFGLSSGMALRKTDGELFPSEQAALFRAQDRQVIESGQGQEFEEVTEQQDGLHTSIVVKFPVTDASGQLSAIGSIATDITERKRTQEQLRLYQEIFTHSIDGIAVLDLQGRYLQQNGTHEEIHGYSTEELSGRTPAIHLGEETFARVGRILATTGSYRGEVESRTKSGAVLIVDLTAFTVRDAKGHPICYVGITRDITERNRAQAALWESEARWQQFAESVNSAFWIEDITLDEQKVLYVNAAFTVIWGIEREEIYRNWSLWLDSIHPDDRVGVKANHDRFVDGEATAVFHCEYRIVGRDGYIRWISDRRVRMAGWTNRIAGIAEDITHDRQRLALMAQTETIGKIGGWELDFVTNRLWWSDETYRLHDTTPELYSPTVETALNFYTPESRPVIAEALGKGIAQGTSWDLELELISAKGRQIAVRAAGKVEVLNGRAVRAYGTFQDITERKRAEEALRRAHDELERKVIERTAELQTSEERYARATAIGKVGVWELDVENGHYYGDTNLKALFGYAPDELSTDPLGWLNLVYPDDQSIAMKHLELVRSGVSDVCHYEIRHVKKDGTLVWGDVRGRSVRDENGRLLRLIGATVDITERKHAEHALRASERDLRTVLDALPIGVWFTDRKGEAILSNPASQRIWTSARQVKWIYDGRTWTESTEHTTGPHRWALAQVLAHGGSSINEMFHLDCGEEGGKTILNTAVPARDEDGTIVGAVVLNEDVTHRVEAEEALRASEERFAKAFRASVHPIVISELETGRLVEANDAAYELTGYSKEESQGQTTLLLGIWPSHEDRTRFIEALKQRGAVRNAEVELRNHRGEIRQCLLSSELIVLNGKQCCVTVGDDITERKRAEEELRQSHRFIRQIIDTDPNFIFAKDREGRFTLVNKAVADCYGTTVENLIGKSDVDFNVSAEEVQLFRQNDLEVMDSAQERFIPEERITDALGKTRWLQTVKRPISDDHGHVRMVLGAATDITERKQMEEVLRQRERALNAALQERERISQDLHDGILQSLYAIGLGLEGCKPLVRQQAESVAEPFMTTLDQAIGQLNQVMGELRNFIAGLESQVIQGGDFPTALRTMVRTMAGSSSATCTVRINDDAARRLSTEQALHIMNVVREGLSNALRHSGAKRITVSLQQLLRSVRVTITDDGVGFHARSVQGVGHGLANMAARAQKVRGVFAIQSKPDKGTRLSLDLPKDAHYAHN